MMLTNCTKLQTIQNPADAVEYHKHAAMDLMVDPANKLTLPVEVVLDAFEPTVTNDPMLRPFQARQKIGLAAPSPCTNHDTGKRYIPWLKMGKYGNGSVKIYESS